MPSYCVWMRKAKCRRSSARSRCCSRDWATSKAFTHDYCRHGTTTLFAALDVTRPDRARILTACLRICYSTRAKITAGTAGRSERANGPERQPDLLRTRRLHRVRLCKFPARTRKGTDATRSTTVPIVRISRLKADYVRIATNVRSVDDLRTVER
jgi:hypothetical protein